MLKFCDVMAKKSSLKAKVWCKYCKSEIHQSKYSLHEKACKDKYLKRYKQYPLAIQLGRACEHCDEPVKYDQYHLHLNRCQKNPANIVCEYCHTVSRNSRYGSHLQQCKSANKIESCKFCGYLIARKSIKQHQQNNCLIECDCKHMIPGKLLREHEKNCDEYLAIERYKETRKVELAKELERRKVRLELEQELQDVEILHWEILPPDANLSNELLFKYFRHLELKGNKPFQYDYERLKKIINLGPSLKGTGKAGFEGYAFFYFERAEAVILECPEYGNATYFIRDANWRELTKLTKFQLKKLPQAFPVVHNDSWLSRVKQILSNLEGEKKYRDKK